MNEYERDLLATFAQHVHDFADFYSEMESGARVSEQYEFSNELVRLKSSGFVVYCGTGTTKLGSQRRSLRTAFVLVFRITNPRVLSKGGERERLFDAAFVDGDPTTFVPVVITWALSKNNLVNF